jgi:3-hydroxyethyl bacteriochlorophyllide a dehydrogenase
VLRRLDLSRAPADSDVVVDIDWSGISTGTEKLLWSGRMPPSRAWATRWCPVTNPSAACVEAGTANSGTAVGDCVFVPGSNCFGEVRGLFGGAAAAPGGAWRTRVLPIDEQAGERGVLLALAATAYHAVSAVPRHAAARPDRRPRRAGPHDRAAGRAGRRRTRGVGNERRAAKAPGLPGDDPADDTRRNYRAICDVSGDAALLDTLISRLAPGGEVVLAGFYDTAAVSSFPARLHARGPHPRGRRMAAPRPGGRARH